MSIINKTNYLDFYNQEYIVFYAEQGDTGTRSITLIPKDNSTLLEFDNTIWKASIIYCKADGKTCFNSATINNDSSITVNLTDQMLAVAGKSLAQLFIYNTTTGAIIRSTKFEVVVNKGIPKENIESSEEFGKLEELFEKITEAYEKVQEALDDLASAGSGGSDTTNFADTSHKLRTYDSADTSHGLSYLLKCIHDFKGDGNFWMVIDDGAFHTVGVDYSSVAGSVAWNNVSGKPTSFTPSAHNQGANTITGGTFGGQVSAPAETDYTTNRIRNIVFLPESSNPGANVSTSYANGSLLCIYE